MGFASYYEDNLDAKGESVRGRYRHLTSSKEKTKKTQGITKSQFMREGMPDFTHRPPLKESPKLLRQKASHNTRQDIRRRELQKTQHARVQKTQHVPVMKTRYVTTEEIQRRIQCEITRQSRLKE